MRRTLLFVEANTTGTGMIALEQAHRLGYRPVLLTRNPGRYHGLAETGAEVVVCETNEGDALAAVASGDLAGVTTTSDFYLAAAADLAALAGLPGNPPEVVRRCRDKAAVRAALGIDQPRYAEVRYPFETAAAVEKAGLPCVVKPVDGSGSENVHVCRTIEEARAQVDAVLAVQRNVRGQAAARRALVEEYVTGPELSVEMFSQGGAAHPVGITEKSVTPPPYPVEWRHVYPALLDPGTEREIFAGVAAMLTAVGYRTGPSHTEIRLGPRGPMLIEINPRLAGGMIPELVRLVDGVDLLDLQLRCAVGEQVRPTRHRAGVAGIQFLTAVREGILRGFPHAAAAAKMPHVTRVTVTAAAGARVGPPRDAYGRLGYVIAAAPDRAEALRSLKQAADLLRADIQVEAIQR